jgi:hypothetical protein
VTVTEIDMWNTRRVRLQFYLMQDIHTMTVVKFEFIVCRNIGCDARFEARTAVHFRIQVALM